MVSEKVRGVYVLGITKKGFLGPIGILVQLGRVA